MQTICKVERWECCHPTWLCFNSYLTAKPTQRRWGEFSEPQCHVLLLHLLQLLTKSMGKRLFVIQIWKQRAARQGSTPSLHRNPVQQGQNELHCAKGKNDQGLLATALRLLMCCQPSAGKGSVPRASNFTLWQSNYMEFTCKGGFYLSAGEVQLHCNSFPVYTDSTHERRKNWIIYKLSL